LKDLLSKNNITGTHTLAFYKGDKKLYQQTGVLKEEEFKSLQEKYLK